MLSKPGDVAGIGWERSECTPPPPGQAPKGRVYFTYGGQRLIPILEDVAGGMWPLVHIQKKVGLLFFSTQNAVMVLAAALEPLLKYFLL